jgi:hypothetical protein
MIPAFRVETRFVSWMYSVFTDPKGPNASSKRVSLDIPAGLTTVFLRLSGCRNTLLISLLLRILSSLSPERLCIASDLCLCSLSGSGTVLVLYCCLRDSYPADPYPSSQRLHGSSIVPYPLGFAVSLATFLAFG